MARIAWILFVAFLFPVLASGQSLGELARKERDRRDENKTRGVATQQFSESEIFEEEEEDTDAEVEGLDGETDVDDDPSHAESRSSVGLEAALEDPDAHISEDEGRNRKRQEAEFRGRYQAAKRRGVAARERKQSLDGIHVVEGVQYVDENGNTVIESLDHLRRLVQEADQDVRAADEAVKALEEEARRGGYPKGWLR